MIGAHSRCVQLIALLAIGCATFSIAPPVTAAAPYQTTLDRWRGAEGEFAGWTGRSFMVGADGSLRLDPATARLGVDYFPPGRYLGLSFYNGDVYWTGEADSPITETPFVFTEAIASWNAETPPGTWVETLLRVRVGDRWSGWYNFGVWASDTETVQRHSIRDQDDALGEVATDTLSLKTGGATAYQIRVRLFTTSGAAPALRTVALARSTTPERPATLAPGNPDAWGRTLPVPECSQMVYPDGGEVWCSPTSTSMVIGYWADDGGPCAPHVRAAVQGVYDPIYRGHGNWPFNTAYAGSMGDLEGYVARFGSLAEAEPWIAAGVPVIFSFAWGPGELANAPLASARGHLAVLVGFDASGNPIVNDPAGPSDTSVQRTYPRAQLETLWLDHSGGTVYLIHPREWRVPAV
ncbi:MAG TPA: peptidase C39 family protein [Dehalococcoidia bacterium]|nr:peptidase C39 family protein [Dehalococcoidia bacterium]